MYSHEELISAVRAAGQDGKTFTVKDVRAHLGFETRDKKEINRFRRRLRAFEKVAADQLEKLGNNSYRLRPGAFEDASVAAILPPSATSSAHASELDLEPTTGVFEAVRPANQTAQPAAHRSASIPKRALSVATALVSSALATSAAVSGKVRERGRNLREQLWSCLRAVPLRRHAIARLRGWVEGLRPLSTEVREQLHALRRRVTSSRRRAA